MFFMIGGLPHRDSSAAPGLAAPERRRDAVARRLHLAAVARGRRLGDRDARRDRHDLHRLVVGDRHDSPEIGGLDPALVPELCREPAQPDLEDQRRMDQASVALASILTAWPVLSEFDKPDATNRYATVPLSPETVERIAVECSKALLHSRGGPDGARGVGEHGGPPRHRAWGAGRHAAGGDWRVAALRSGESRCPNCRLLAVKTATVAPMWRGRAS
jgi:hypothetical protein